MSAFGLAQAERYYTGLIDALVFLAEYPLAARARPELGAGTRALPYKSHLIFYRVEAGGVFVQRIRHGREDWSDPSVLA